VVCSILFGPFRTTIKANFLFIAFKCTKTTSLLALSYTAALILSIKPKNAIYLEFPQTKTTVGCFKSVNGFSPQPCLRAITSAGREVNLWLQKLICGFKSK
jgi:hypothetical protein